MTRWTYICDYAMRFSIQTGPVKATSDDGKLTTGPVYIKAQWFLDVTFVSCVMLWI